MKIPLNFNQKGGAIALLLLVPTLVLIAIFSNPKNFNSLKKVVLNFLPITIFASSGPDLSVSFIERTLRFERYNVTYPNDYPRLVSGTEGYQRWPTAGQTVKFTASIKNAGTASSSATIYRWFIDNQEVKKGTLDGLAQGENKKEELDWSWQDGDHTVKFIVDPDNNLTEISKQNNQLEDRTNSLSFRIHVDKTVYDKFNSFLNIIGTYSFEDWIQQHIKAFNQKIESSGGKTRIRVDQISVEPDHLTDPGGTHAPMDMEWDGRWGFVMPDWCKSVDCPDRPDGINYWVTKIQPSLLHEWSHQIGMAHSYDANVDIASNNLISGTRLIQKNPDIVGTGGDDVGGAFEQNKPLTPYFIFALDSTLGFRRGYYAEYLFDTPDQNIVSFKDAFSNPLTNAQVKVWQKQDGKVSGEPMLTGSTDSNGNFSLPNKPIPEGNLTTATGHTLKANPFGQIKVVGQNGLFLFEIQKEGQIDYQILTIHDFNLAYFKGAKASANYTLKTAIVSNANPTNLMLKKPASASTNDSQAYMAVDGDKTSIDTGYWSPANAQGNIGDFLKVDLGASNSLYKIIVYASAQNGHDMYQQF
ncbi:hypothetical protein HYS97_01470, partial [Candidatus Daviesbacteria bacterium]|nr:hypothetical protein [Candidatus Daviesbacteria bacterium]